MAKILKNTTGSDIDIKSMGLMIPASGQIDINDTDYLILSEQDTLSELAAAIISGDIVVNTGEEDLNATEAANYIKFPDEAVNVHFKPDTISSNGFVSRNVQDAVEEAFNQANAAIYPISIVYNGTVSNGTFFSYSNLTPGTPIVVPINSEFIGFTFSNSNSNADYTIRFRNNSNVTTPFESVTKVNTQFFVDILTTPEQFTAGNFLSIEYVDDGTNASDVALTLFFRAVA